ncbi:MAG: hypothetical protein M0Q15_17960 [Nevskia sp.]|jgi:hypothetical protein|nr:hypothetical protein [Nevskia sp.]
MLATLADDNLDVTAELGEHAHQAFDGNIPELTFEQARYIRLANESVENAHQRFHQNAQKR